MEDINNFIEEEHINESEFFEIIKSIVYSAIGIFVFFIPININGHTSTIIFQLSYKIQNEMAPLLKIFIIVFVLLGCIKPVISAEGSKIVSGVRFISLILVLIIFYGNKNIILVSDNTLLLIEELILNTSTILPITAIFMTFLIDYGLLDIIESFSHKFMKNTYKMSGKTVVNILIYLFTDYFCGYFITNNMYKKGRLRENEAVMLITNFSIGSIWLFNYICNELNIDKLHLIIISSIIMFIVNFIICRIYPFNKKKKSYYIKTNYKETLHKKDRFKKGFDKYIKNNSKKNIFKEIINNLEECFQVIINLLPSLILILCMGDIIFRMDIITEIYIYILNPVLNILKLSDINVLSKFLSMILYNDVIAIDSVANSISYTSKLIIGMITMIGGVSLSSNIIFIKYTNINISVKELVLIFIQRIILILTVYCLISYTLIGYIM